MDSEKHDAKNSSDKEMAIRTDMVKRECVEDDSIFVNTPVTDNEFSNAENFRKESGFRRLKRFSLIPADTRTNRTLSVKEKSEIRREIDNDVPVAIVAKCYDVPERDICNIKNEKGSIPSIPTNLECKSNNSNWVSSDSNVGNNVSNKSRKKHNVLSYATKLEIIEKGTNGEKFASLSRIYNVHLSTIYKIIKQKSAIINSVSQIKCDHTLTECKHIRKPLISVENDLFEWYSQKHIQGEKVTRIDLCEKAFELHKSRGSSDFKASRNWLRGFKKRYGIKRVTTKAKVHASRS